MRRAVPAIVVTLLGLGALAAFKSSPGLAARPAASAPARTTTTTPPATAPPAGGDGPAPTEPPTSPTTSAKSGNTTPKNYDGDPFDNRFGTVQVRITVQGNRITAVEPVQMPFDHARSQYISQQAEPYLRQEALQAQSANIQIVSGATYTSDGYAQSLQSALDKAGI